MNTTTFSTKFVAGIASISLIGGFLGGLLSSNIVGTQKAAVTESPRVVEERKYIEESDTVSAIEKVVPAVVSIVASKDIAIFKNQNDPFFFFNDDPFLRDFFGTPQQEQRENEGPQTERRQIGGGTGFIIQEDGLAITNKHVVSDANADYSALTNDGTEYDLEIIARDPVNDLAIVQLHKKNENESTTRKTGEERKFGAKPEKLKIVALADSDKLRVGQRVLAVGNARGEYQNSVTSGIISAIGRDIQAGDRLGQFSESLSGLIQTDAAINFGNSGGPLVNLEGQVVGVNTAVDAAANGVGFAIPVNQIKPAIESVKKTGRIVRPMLGVRHMILTKELAENLNIKGIEYGALITGDRTKKEFGVIPGSPAEKAGLRIDDVILEVNGKKIDSENPLSKVIRDFAPGDTLTLKVWRAGNVLEFKVALQEYKE